MYMVSASWRSIDAAKENGSQASKAVGAVRIR
jgi:hypothetical protein